MSKSSSQAQLPQDSNPSPRKSKLHGNLDVLYQGRFNPQEVKSKSRIWKVLCRDFFQKFVPEDAAVLDLAAGYCDFINNIQCGEKYAIDLNKDTVEFAEPNVKVFHVLSTQMSCLSDASVDIVFTSNFLEHLRSKEEVLKTFQEVHRILKKGGKFMILQPNIRYCGWEYWDFFDHHVPLTEKSLIEGLQIHNFKISKVIPKFLPFTTKSHIPQHPILVWLYLKVPLVWRIMGKQSFLIADK